MTNAPFNDDLFQNRLAEMLRGLNGETYETDDAIEALLDAVTASSNGLAPSGVSPDAHAPVAEPLTEDEVSRVLQKTRELIRQSPTEPGMTSLPGRPPVPRAAPHSTAEPPLVEMTTPRAGDEHVRKTSDAPSPHGHAAARVSLAGAVLALLLTFGSLLRQDTSTTPQRAVAGGPALKLSALFRNGQVMATQYQIAAPKRPDVTLQIGESISTGPLERLRVGLPDGSVAFLNADSSLTADSARRFTLSQGEAYFEVQPVEEAGLRSEPFVVQTLDRTLTAVGTKFDVKAGSGEADNSEPSKLVVTQGRVRLPNVEPVIAAGQEVALSTTKPDSTADAALPAIQPSKRASEVLAWTRDLIADAAPEIVPASEHRGGSITVVDPNGQEMRLSLRKFHIDVHVEGGFARTAIDQTYFNHTFSRQEGTFHFPLPPDASLSRLAMYVNGKLMEGGMVERDHGRNVYEQIRHTRRDPALLEWVDGSTFKMRVFPLEARQEKRIVLSYTQRLPKNYDRTTYRFPAGHTLEGVRDWSAHLRIVDGKSNGLRWFSPSHLLRVVEPSAGNVPEAGETAAREDATDDLVLAGTLLNAAFDRDLVVELETHSSNRNSLQRSALERSQGRSASPHWTAARANGARYLLLRYQPDLPSEMTRPKRNWVFVVETSADRDNVLRNAQREILRTILDNAEHDDSFALVLAASRSSSFRARPVFCTVENVESALHFLDETPSLGALDLAEALKLSERFCRSEAVENWMVHIGSSVGVIGRRDEQTLRNALPRNTRYAGIGVGHRWNRSFMRDAASRTGGHFTQINPDEEVSWRAFEFLSAINAPRLLDLKVNSDRKDVTFLTFAETIAHGQEIAAVTRLKAGDKLPQTVTLSGAVDGKPWKQTLSVSVAAKPESPKPAEGSSHYLPRIWAKLEIDRLVAAGAEQHRTAITELSKSMYVMSPFTSLLVLEDEAMYQQFNVDRGRKDHWALYPAPEKIDVVYESGRSGPQPVDSLETITEQLQTATDERDAAQSNLQTAEGNAASSKQLTSLKSQLAVAQSKVDRLATYRDTLQKLRDDELLNAAKPIVQRQPTWRTYRWVTSNHQGLNPSFWGRQPVTFTDDFGLRVLRETNGRPNLLGFTDRWGIPETWEFRGDVPLGWRQARMNWDDSTWFDNNHFGTRPLNTWVFDPESSRRIALTDQGRVALRTRFDTTVFESRRGGVSRFALPSQLFDQSDFEVDFTVPVDVIDVPGSQGSFISSDLTLTAPKYVPMFTRTISDLDGWQTEFESLEQELREGVEYDLPNVGLVDLGADMNFVRPLRLDLAGTIPTLAEYRRLSGGEEPIRYYFRDGDFDSARDEIFQFQLLAEQDREVLSRRRRYATSSPHRFRLGAQAAAPPADFAWGNLTFSVPSDLPVDANGDGVEFLLPQLVESFEYEPPLAYAVIDTGRPRAGMISDPIERCPGMATWPADRRVAIQAAAEKEKLIVRGEVSPEAANLIERARARGWESVTISPPEQDGKLSVPCPQVFVNGAGQFRIERSLLDGLQETVICDGESLWHLYPDFAVGARRDARLIADAILQSLVPWYVTDAVSLSRGANVDLVGENTLRITPLANAGLKQNAEKGGKSGPRLPAIELVFDAEARLIERRLVETQSGDVLSRQEYRSDGSVVSFVDDKQLESDETFERVACDAPALTPDSEFVAVLPLPYRTVDRLDIPSLTEKEDGTRDFSKLSQDDALKLIAAYFATGKDTDMYQVMEQCFFAKGDYPLGFATLLHSKNPREVTAIQTATSRHPNHPLSQYLRQAAEWNLHGNPAVEFTLPDSATRYLKTIQATQNIFGRWSSGAAYRDRTGTQTATELSRDLKTILEVENTRAVWFLLQTIAEQLPNVGDAQAFLYRKLASTAATLEDRPGQYVSARVQRVKWLLKADAGDEAARLYAEFLLHEADAIAQRGGAVLLDAEVHEALDRERWRAAVRAEAAKFVEHETPLVVVALAEACLSVEELELADELFESVFDADALPENPRLAAVALPFLTKRDRHSVAEHCFQTLLSVPLLAADASLWRHASTNAKQLGDLDEAARRLEHALQIEFARLPEQINVEQFRTHYSSAFDLLDEAVAAAQNAESPMPSDLAGRIRELGDRWRSIDPDATQPCFRTARLLLSLDLPFVAWDYWTSPLATVPNNSNTWSSLATELGRASLVDRASAAWDEAFACESTNPDFLLGHATLLREHGRFDKADSLLRQIVDGKWQPRFEQTKQRASELLK
ncbi:hypothetical protein GC176_01870 [bacterium]|nr:hypothetical protein [bacterium]